MLFKYDTTISLPTGKPDESLRLDLGNIEILISATNENKHTSFVATIESTPNDKNLAILNEIAQGTLPKAAKPYRTLSIAVSPGASMQNHVTPSNILPEHFNDYAKKLGQNLSDAIKKTYKLIRWRYDVGGKHTPFSFRSFSFSSNNGSTWHRMPSNTRVSIYAEPVLSLKRYDSGLIEDLAKSDAEEPVSDELLLEARDLYRARNYRSSLILAVTALEVGVKRFISRVAPDAGWLMRETASPPVKKLIIDYLPTLTAIDKGRAFPTLPATVTKRIEAFVFKRNQLVHSYSGVVVSDDFVNEAINTVRDICWILEVCLGHAWALSYMSKEAVQHVGWSVEAGSKGQGVDVGSTRAVLRLRKHTG